jgi:phytoene/squalene synthetase
VVTHDDALSLAYAQCERRSREHYENFPVASRLLPAAMRPHIAAIYAFARTADDFADEPGLAPDERLRLLDDWARRLAACSSGSGSEFREFTNSLPDPVHGSRPDPHKRGPCAHK